MDKYVKESSIEFIKSFDAQIMSIKRQDYRADITYIIKRALETRQVKEEIMFLLSRLASEYQMFDKLEDAESVINELIALEPNSPYGWMSLASHFHYFVSDLPKAFSTIDVAIEKALADGNSVIQAYCKRIRIVLDMKDYKAVEDSLDKMLKYRPEPGSIGVMFEGDFIKRIPAGSIDSRILEEYKRLCGYKS